MSFHRKVQTDERQVKSCVRASPICPQPRRTTFIAFDYIKPAIELVNNPKKQNLRKKIISAIELLRNPVLETDRAVTHDNNKSNTIACDSFDR